MSLLGAIRDIYELRSGMKAVLSLFFCRLVWIQASIHTCFSEVRRCNILEKLGEIRSRFEMQKGTTVFGQKENGEIETDLGSPNIMTEMKIKVFQLCMMFCVSKTLRWPVQPFITKEEFESHCLKNLARVMVSS